MFAAWPGLVNDEDDTATYAPYEKGNYYARLYPADLRRWHRALDGLRETADLAAERGITLALQNHAPVLRPGYEDTLAMMRELDRPNVGLCLDAPLFKERQSDDYMREAVRACARARPADALRRLELRRAGHGRGRAGAVPVVRRRRSTTRRYLAELQQAGYDGYLVSEYCLPCVKDHRIAGIDEIDRATAMALALHEEPGDDAADGLSSVAQSERTRLVGRTRLDCPRTRS